MTGCMAAVYLRIDVYGVMISAAISENWAKQNIHKKNSKSCNKGGIKYLFSLLQNFNQRKSTFFCNFYFKRKIGKV